MDKEFMLMYDNHVNPHSSPDCQSLLGSHLYFHYVYLWLSTFDVPVAYFYEQVVTKFRDRRFGQRLYCLGTTVQSEKLVKKLLCNDCKSLFAKHVPGLIYFGPWGLAFKVLKEWNSTSSYIGSCKVEVKWVYWIGYQGGSMVTQL